MGVTMRKALLSVALLLGVLQISPVTAQAQDGAWQPAVARAWHGKTLRANADGYESYLADAIKKFPSIKGNMGYQMMRLDGETHTEFQVISYWQSLDSIKAYAGEDISKTRHLPRDAEFLIDVEPNVRNYSLKANLQAVKRKSRGAAWKEGEPCRAPDAYA